MATDHFEESFPFEPTFSFSPWPQRLWIATITTLLMGGLGIWYSVKIITSPHRNQSKSSGVEGVTGSLANASLAKLDGVCMLKGKLEPYEVADLYSKFSGILYEQSVDIGDRVHAGQVLAKISAPETEKLVELTVAKVEHAEAVVKQVQARIFAMETENQHAESSLLSAKTTGKENLRKSLEGQLVPIQKKEPQTVSSPGSVAQTKDHAHSGGMKRPPSESMLDTDLKKRVETARLNQAKADLEEAVSQAAVAKRELERSRLLWAFSRIASPYDGLVTRRSFHRGEFVKSVDGFRDCLPVFTVERTDKMRVVFQLPACEAQYAKLGSKTTVEVEGLPGKIWNLTITRLALSVDPATQTMRAELEIPNSDGKFHRGMVCTVKLLLEKDGKRGADGD